MGFIYKLETVHEFIDEYMYISGVSTKEKNVVVVTADQVGKGRREGRDLMKYLFSISIHFFWCFSTVVPELAVQMCSAFC